MKHKHLIIRTAIITFFVTAVVEVAFFSQIWLNDHDPRRILKNFPTNNPNVVYVMYCGGGDKYIVAHSSPELSESSGIASGFLGKSAVDANTLCGKKFQGILKVCPESKNCINKPAKVDIMEVTKVLGDIERYWETKNK